MAKIILISCVASKQKTHCKAKDMYISPLFKKSWKYANQLQPDKIFIISAKHHLLDPEEKIAPYNETLYDFTSTQRKEWAKTVLKALESKVEGSLNEHEFIILAGKKYYEYLIGRNGIQNFSLPLEGHGGIGCILKFLNEQINKL